MMVYFHAGKILVQNGQKVKAGDALCLEGNTGFVVSGSTPYWGNAPAGKGTHLHFGIYPLIQGTDKGNAYWINGQGYIKEFPNNGYNGATDPLRFYLETEAQTVIDKAKLVIANVLAYLKGRTK